jgi:hypothetical protein
MALLLRYRLYITEIVGHSTRMSCQIDFNTAGGTCSQEGRAIAQAVSRRLPTAAVRVQTRVW